MAPRHLLLAFLLPAVVLTVAGIVAPELRVSMSAAAPITFVGAVLTSMGAVYFGARAPLSTRTRFGVLAIVALLLAIASRLRPFSPVACVLAGIALPVLASTVGAALGERVRSSGHMLAAGLVAAAADLFSVTSPHGPSHAVLEVPAALALLLVSFPIVGTHAWAPAFGAADLLFCALLLGVARTHKQSYARTFALCLAGALLAGVVSAILAVPCPALPILSLVVIGATPAFRAVPREDRRATGVAALLLLLVLGSVLWRLR